MELQRLEFYVLRMRNLVICYFIFKNQSHCSGIRGQRVKPFISFHLPSYGEFDNLYFAHRVLY